MTSFVIRNGPLILRNGQLLVGDPSCCCPTTTPHPCDGRACFDPSFPGDPKAGDCDPGCTCLCGCRQTIVKPGSATPPTVPGVYMAVGAYEHDGITEVTLSAYGYGTDCDPSGKSFDEQFNPAYCPINAIPGEGSDVDLNQQLIGNETGDGVIEVSGNDIPAYPPFPPPPPGFSGYGWKIVNGPFAGWYFIEWSDNGIHTGRCNGGVFP